MSSIESLTVAFDCMRKGASLSVAANGVALEHCEGVVKGLSQG
jgi:hypothetical protein